MSIESLELKPRLLLEAILMWFFFIPCAILNGGFRNSVITPALGEHVGHVISTLTFIVIIVFFTRLWLNRTKVEYIKIDMILIGIGWIIATIIFEFIFGHYIMGHSWDKLLADYNLFNGRVWVFVLLTSLISPWLFGWYLGRKTRNNSDME